MKKGYLILGGLALVGIYLLTKKNKVEVELKGYEKDRKSMGVNTGGIFGSDMICPEGKNKKAIGGGIAGGIIYGCV